MQLTEKVANNTNKISLKENHKKVQVKQIYKFNIHRKSTAACKNNLTIDTFHTPSYSSMTDLIDIKLTHTMLQLMLFQT